MNLKLTFNQKISLKIFAFFIFTTFIIGANLTKSLAAATASLNPDQVKKLLDYSDRTRGSVQGGLEWDVTLQSWDDGDESTREFKVHFKGNDSYVESLKPPRYKGEIYLFNTRTMWFYKPDLSKPISISTRQKLTGAAQNGDIASTAYARDYKAQFVKMDNVAGDDCYLLQLKSVAKDTTYDQIHYWISKKSGLGVKAEFLSLSGKKLKAATFEYENKIKQKGKELPFISKMAINDIQNQKNRSILTYKNPILTNQPDSLFNINNLIR